MLGKRARTSANRACGSTSFNVAVAITLLREIGGEDQAGDVPPG
jgi:hypothetical protein